MSYPDTHDVLQWVRNYCIPKCLGWTLKEVYFWKHKFCEKSLAVRNKSNIFAGEYKRK